MKRAMMAVMLGAIGSAGEVCVAQEHAHWLPHRIAAEVSQAIAAEDGGLSVFRSDVREDGAWGLALISEVRVEGDAVNLYQAYLGDRGRYFYPASTVKLFAALAAYEQINDLAGMYADGPAVMGPFARMTRLDERTPLRIHPLFEGEALREITVAGEVHKVFVVSDNPAFNSLYDFLGQDDLNRRIRQWGAGRTQIVHRLSVARTADENRRAPRVDLGLEPGAPQLGQRMATAVHVTQPNTTLFRLGDGFVRDGEIVREPLDFSDKNYTSLHDLQMVLARLVRPDVTHSTCCPSITSGSVFGGGDTGPLPGRPLRLTDAQRDHLLASATMLPRESESPRYDPAEFPDDHVKFLLPGLLRVRPLEEWRVVNKIGLAYGFVTENAYIEHRPTGHAVFVAAVIHRNPNGIYNDNQYDYETSLSEMAVLGEVIGRALAARPTDSEPE
jgi:hypothetical protein